MESAPQEPKAEHKPAAARPRPQALPASEGEFGAPAGMPLFLAGGAPPPVQPRLRVNRPGDVYEQEADRVADQVTSMPRPPVQPKLRVNRPGDVYEREADRVADQVTRMPRPQVQRACACGGSCDSCRARPDDELVQRAADSSSPAAPTVPVSAARPASGGQPLDPSVRADVEARFGRDFSAVRVHSGPAAARRAEAIQARAYTLGSDIVFGTGEYAPHSQAGRHLLAHELAHVVQQAQGAPLQVQRNGDGTGVDDPAAGVSLPITELDVTTLTNEDLATTLHDTRTWLAQHDQADPAYADYQGLLSRLQVERTQRVQMGYRWLEVDWNTTPAELYQIEELPDGSYAGASADLSLALGPPAYLGSTMIMTQDQVTAYEQQREADTAGWYQRAAAFSSGLEMIQVMLTETVAQIRAEQADWYVVSDRTFTRPVVQSIIAGGNQYRRRVAQFIAESPPDDPLLAQLREDLASYDRALEALRGEVPPAIGTAESMGRGFVGGVKGAGGAFLSFLRLGLWDSWGQLVFEGSERRVNEAQEGMMQMMLDIDEQGFGSAIGGYASQGFDRYLENIENEQYITASEQFGSAAFDTYFVGRGLVSLGQGMRGMSRAATAARALGNPRPWMHAMGLAAREMVSFRGVGLHGGRGVWGTSYGIPQVGPGGTVRIIRFVRGEEDLIAKSMRQPETMMLDAQGQPRPIGDVARQHISSSDPGSPLQSAYPYADAETMIVANPEGLASVSGPQAPGYYVVIEVPADKALINVNRMLLGRGPNPELANLPEVQANRFGLRLPEELRPASLRDVRPQSLFDEPYARLPPETRVWAEQNIDFGPGARSQAALSELQGIQYLEWEHLALAPDLRPYVVEVRPNPTVGGANRPLFMQPGEPSFFHPSLNPRAIAGLAQADPAAVWPRAQTQFSWLASESAAGRTPFTVSQVTAAQRMAMLGGYPLEMPLAGVAPPGRGQPRSPSQDDLRGYIRWMSSTTGAVPQTMQQTFEAAVEPEAPQRGMPGQPAIGTTMQDLSMAATQIAGQAGSRVTGFRSGPNIVSLQVTVPDVDGISTAVQTVIDRWQHRSGDVTVALTITVQADIAPPIDLDRMIAALEPPDNLRITIHPQSGAARP